MHSHQPQKRTIKGYYFASSIQEAIAYLMAHHGQSQVIGGGTLLLPLAQQNGDAAFYLADVSRVSSICRVTESDDDIVIGGANTFARLQQNGTIRARAPLLCQAAEQMSTPQIRQLATLAGNVVSAQGNAHGAVALVALDAEVEITNSTGPQWLPIHALFGRHGISRVDSGTEIVTGFRVPVRKVGQGMALASLPSACAQGRSPLVLAINLGLQEDGHALHWVALAMGSIGSAPTRLPKTEESLLALPLDEARTPILLGEAIRADTQEQHRLNDAPDVDYDRIPALVADALSRALDMASSSISSGLTYPPPLA
jgi:CO/xanthine dehydrogenase FAD-binding subunit